MWRATEPVFQAHFKEQISEFSKGQRDDAKETIRENNSDVVQDLARASRESWNRFVDEVIDNCPSMSLEEVGQVAQYLANLESSNSQYSLIAKLYDMTPGDLDAWNDLLTDWTVRTAKAALDENQTRLKLIEELDLKLRDASVSEVQELQPLFDRSLWIFGPKFESIEFTSNKGMTTVIREIFGGEEQGSRNRTDIVVLPEGSVGFYSRDSHGEDREVNGVASLVVVEIKKPGVTIGDDEMNQGWKYVKELKARGYINTSTKVHCFVLGSDVEAAEESPPIGTPFA